MAIERMPITPEVITWARKRAGYSVDSLTNKREQFKRLAAWESGDNKPTYRQLELLSDDLQIPVAVFFFPSPPNLPPLKASFRTLDNEQFEAIPPPVRLLLHKARAFQIGLYELNEGRNPSRLLFTRDFTFSPNDSDDDIAAQIRSFLDVSVQQQCAWKNEEDALRQWRRALYNIGIHVFRGPFKGHEYSGFCLYDVEFPVIFLNSSNSKARQIFTLFHELAHLIYKTSGVDKLDKTYVDLLLENNRLVEVKCNRLAAFTLVPNDEFDSELTSRPFTADLPRQLARLFHVSNEVIYRKLLDRRLISQEVYDSAKSSWVEGSSSDGNGGHFYNTFISYLGEEYISLAFQRYYQDVISFEDLADYLDTRPRNLEKLEEYMLQRGV